MNIRPCPRAVRKQDSKKVDSALRPFALCLSSLSTPEGQARAAASFDALFGKVLPLTGQATEAAPYYSDDILIAPSYLVQTRRLSSFSTEVCVKVVGYRGVVTGFEDSKIRRDSDGKVTAPNQVVVPDEVQGKFSITVF